MFSHQWLGWEEPDPKNVHYTAMVLATDGVVIQMQWSMQNVYLWVDYHSVPQRNRAMQALAIITLPCFASLSSIMVIVAPDTTYVDTKLVCDFETYSRRMCCWAEVFSFYCRRDLEDMYKADKDGAFYKLHKVEEHQVHDLGIRRGLHMLCAEA